MYSTSSEWGQISKWWNFPSHYYHQCQFKWSLVIDIYYMHQKLSTVMFIKKKQINNSWSALTLTMGSVLSFWCSFSLRSYTVALPYWLLAQKVRGFRKRNPKYIAFLCQHQWFKCLTLDPYSPNSNSNLLFSAKVNFSQTLLIKCNLQFSMHSLIHSTMI